MSRQDFKRGDRIEWVGDDPGPRKGRPRPGERGTVVFLDPLDDVIDWDEAGTIAVSLRSLPVRLVADGTDD